MGIKFEIKQKQKERQREDENTLSTEESTADIQNNNEAFGLILKKNLKTILIYTCMFFGILCIISLIGFELKSKIVDCLCDYRELTIAEYFFLVLYGTISSITGVNILFFETSLGCVLSHTYLAVLIAILSKTFGMIISYTIMRKLIQKYLSNKLKNNIYLRILSKITNEEPIKVIGTLAILQIPMLLINLNLVLFQIRLKYIIKVFCLISIFQSCLFCIIGSTLSSRTCIQNQRIDINDILIYLLNTFTLVLFYAIYKKAQSIKMQNNIILWSDNFFNNNLVKQKISYLNTQNKANNYQIKIVYPKFNNEDT